MSTALLGLNGLFGLRGWQVMFIFEAIPTVLIGIVAFFYLTNRPSEARWLTAEEKSWLDGTLSGERRHIETEHGIGILRSFFDPKVLLLSLNYIGIVTASLGLLLFLPQIIKQLGVSNMQVGWITMIPYIFGAISMVVCGWISDHVGDRRWSLFATCLISVVGLVFAGMTVGTWWSLVGIIIAAIGFYGTKGPFWSMPTMFLTGPAAASGIAWINSLGNLGGFFGPTIVGWAKQLTGSFAGGLYALAICASVSAVVSLIGLNLPGRVRPPEAATIPAQ